MVPRSIAWLAGIMPTQRVLILAFSAVVASFLGATAYAEHRAAAIDAHAQELAEQTSPSIEHLARARLHVLALQEQLRASAAGAASGARSGLAASSPTPGRTPPRRSCSPPVPGSPSCDPSSLRRGR